MVQLIHLSYKTLFDLDLSWCNLSFENAQELLQCLKDKATDIAETYYSDKIHGTIRYLNLGYNSFRHETGRCNHNNVSDQAKKAEESPSDSEDEE